MSAPEPQALSTLPAGQKGRVVAFDLPGDQKQRLLEMGLTVGTEFQVVRYAPLGDPLEIKVRGYHLSFRKSEADGVRVVPL